MPLPGRPALPACLCASAQEKGWGFPEKQARLFSRKSPAFSFARELSCRHRKFQARIVCFIRRATSPRWVQGPMVPGSGVRGLKKPPLLRTAGNSLAALKLQAHIACFTKRAASPKTGPGPGGSWFRGPGAEEAPASSRCREFSCRQTPARHSCTGRSVSEKGSDGS